MSNQCTCNYGVPSFDDVASRDGGQARKNGDKQTDGPRDHGRCDNAPASLRMVAPKIQDLLPPKPLGQLRRPLAPYNAHTCKPVAQVAPVPDVKPPVFHNKEQRRQLVKEWLRSAMIPNPHLIPVDVNGIPTEITEEDCEEEWD